jgi:hypothetical protein
LGTATRAKPPQRAMADATGAAGGPARGNRAAPPRSGQHRLLLAVAVTLCAPLLAPVTAGTAPPLCFHTPHCDHTCAPPWRCSFDPFGDACGGALSDPPGVFACIRPDGRVDGTSGADCYEHSGCNAACADRPGTSCMQHAASARAWRCVCLLIRLLIRMLCASAALC